MFTRPQELKLPLNLQILTLISVEEVPAEESYCSLTKWPPETPENMTMTGGGGVSGVSGDVADVGADVGADVVGADVADVGGEVSGEVSGEGSVVGSAGGGKTPHPLGHVQVSVSLDTTDDFSGQCTHELTAEENIINNKTYPLHKYESLYDENSLELYPETVQSGGGSESRGGSSGYTIPHQHTIPVGVVNSNVDDLGDWNKDSIQLLIKP